MGGPVESKPPQETKTLPAGPVMTKEQLDTLRRQISTYATLCSQLVELRRKSNPERDVPSGTTTIMMANTSSKDKGKRRWAPSQKQLQTLKRIFKEVGGTPARQGIREIAADLSKYGPINESNVYNWFQNRKARAKKANGSRRRRRFPQDDIAAMHDQGQGIAVGQADGGELARADAGM